MIFEDLNTYDGNHTVYPNCNENLVAWRELLEGISVDRAAGICSGGEVSFFAILPCVRKKLDLIDHAYGSMYHAIGKYHAVEKLGSVKAHKLLTTHERRPRQSRTYDINTMTYLPVPLTEKEALFAEANEPLPTKGKGRHAELSRPMAAHVSQKDMTEFRANREKITFLHGDLNDLVERGPYDLVYVSNALDYSGRDGNNFRVTEMVKPGGYIMAAHSGGSFALSPYYDRYGAKHKSFTEYRFPSCEVFRQKPYLGYQHRDQTGGYGLSWNYTILRTPA